MKPIACLLLAVFGLADFSLADPVATPETRLLWTDEPVTLLDEGGNPRRRDKWASFVYPIGNGRLGATIFGGPAEERIQFNEDSLWVGNEHNTGGYQPFGDIYLELPHQEFSDYRRQLDISRAVHTIAYKSGGVGYKREYFSSYPDQVMVMRFTADKPGALSGKVFLGNDHELPMSVEGEDLVLKGDTGKFWWWQQQVANEKKLLADREYASDQNIDLKLEARCRVAHEGGSVKAEGAAMVFENCDTLTLILSADTNYVNRREEGWTGPDPHERVLAWLDAASGKPYPELLSHHIDDYQSLYGRVSIDLGETPGTRTGLKTSERVEKYKEEVKAGGFGAAADHDLEELIYQYARYLIISSSREGHGTLPANLQGLWLIDRRPPWRCDYHTDINVQMCHWLTGTSNLPECFVPLAEWIDSIREVRKEETRRVFGIDRGWLMRSENNVFGGSTWHVQKGDSAWLCQSLWDHYAFTRDKEYLRTYAYPVMKEISEFWVDHLKELPDGTLVAPDGRSPEHGPEKADGVTYDQQLCWDLFTNVIEAGEVLGVDEEYRKQLEGKRAKLLGPKIGRWGQLQEWMEDIDDPKDTHRHTNHLIGVYPGRQISPTGTPEFAEAAKVGLIARGHGPTGWSKAWKISLFARLLEGQRSYEILSDLIASKTFGNLWMTHPPFQIDANFGYAAGVNEMLAQSHTGEIHLLPAVPEAWSTGSAHGLRARGDFEVDLDWKDGKLTKAVVRAGKNSPEECTIRSGGKTVMLKIKPGSEETLTAGSF